MKGAFCDAEYDEEGGYTIYPVWDGYELPEVPMWTIGLAPQPDVIKG